MIYQEAVLDVIDEEKLQENSKIVGTYFLNKLSELRDEFEIVGDVRGKGNIFLFKLLCFGVFFIN